MDKKWTEESARRCLERNGYNVGAKTIEYKGATGIKLNGCIDYLVNYHGYKRGKA